MNATKKIVASAMLALAMLGLTTSLPAFADAAGDAAMYCSGCHNGLTVTDALGAAIATISGGARSCPQRTASEWTTTIERMNGKGCGVPAGSISGIANYLAGLTSIPMPPPLMRCYYPDGSIWMDFAWKCPAGTSPTPPPTCISGLPTLDGNTWVCASGISSTTTTTTTTTLPPTSGNYNMWITLTGNTGAFPEHPGNYNAYYTAYINNSGPSVGVADIYFTDPASINFSYISMNNCTVTGSHSCRATLPPYSQTHITASYAIPFGANATFQIYLTDVAGDTMYEIGGTDNSASLTLIAPTTTTTSTTSTTVTTVATTTTTTISQGTPTLTSITVNPASAVVEVNKSVWFSATGTYSDGSSKVLPEYRDSHTATKFENGSVLIAGGVDGISQSITSTEIYDPITGSFSTARSMIAPRSGHTATVLENGKILIAGGVNMVPTSGAGGATGSYLTTAELYDPATGIFSTTGSMVAARGGHTATLLNNGKVLIAGGSSTATIAEIYDPTTGSFSITGSMTINRSSHSATSLSDGKVLITGGWSSTGGGPGVILNSAELYNPVTGTFSSTNTMSVARSRPKGTLLGNGTVLITGGSSASYVAEVYDPISGTFSTTGSMTDDRSNMHTATLLGNGKVLIVGSGNTNLSELYDPATGTFSVSPMLSQRRTIHTATLLENGNVLVFGGATDRMAELYDTQLNIWRDVSYSADTLVWSIADTSIATGSGHYGFQATGRSHGSTTITATSNAISGSAALTVTPSIVVEPPITPADFYCTGCHAGLTITGPTGAVMGVVGQGARLCSQRTATEWTSTINRMNGKGCGVPSSLIADIANYLAGMGSTSSSSTTTSTTSTSSSTTSSSTSTTVSTVATTTTSTLCNTYVNGTTQYPYSGKGSCHGHPDDSSSSGHVVRDQKWCRKHMTHFNSSGNHTHAYPHPVCM